MRTRFLDTNVLVYLATADDEKRQRAQAIVADGGTVSAQVLNEFVDVLRRKMRMSWPETAAAAMLAKGLLDVVPVTLDTHERALLLASRHDLRIYDATILAAALLAGCDTLYTEDMHSGFLLENRLRIVNPFAAA